MDGVDMPDRPALHLITFIRQNKGTLSSTNRLRRF